MIKIIALILFFTLSTFSQTDSSEQTLYTLFDKTVGASNTDISYGAIHTEKYKSLDNDHQYFKSKQFYLGKINYQQQTFFNVSVKYNVAQDALLVRIDNQTIVLESNLVSNFTLHNCHFINHSILGYVAVISDVKPLQFYKKHNKNKVKKLNESYIYYKFSDDNKYYLDYQSKLFSVSSKKDIIKIFPTYKSDVKKFYKTNKSLLKKDLDQFYKKLIILLDKEIKTPK
ncbi:hypothetical protein [Polaribacter sp. R77954]|uniref:hypothetical protein n=1 Tax=Polaribacter sp. R77954 TaxID=3093870 RepID=UPI0037C9A566